MNLRSIRGPVLVLISFLRLSDQLWTILVPCAGYIHSLSPPISSGLAIDYTKELLYVIDGHTHKLISIDLFGNHETLILEDPRKILHPFALGVYKVSSVRARLQWAIARWPTGRALWDIVVA